MPPLLQAERATYAHLANDVWNADQTPSGIAHRVRTAGPRDSGRPGVGIAAHDVDYELADGVGFHIVSLRGELVPHRAMAPVDFDNPESYDIHVIRATVQITPKDLDALFNRYVLTDTPRALSSVKNDTAPGELRVALGARLFRMLPTVGGLPTTLAGGLHVSDNDRLVYRPSTVTSLGLPIAGLLHVLHLSLAQLTPLDRPGVRLIGDRLVMDPRILFPPPHLVIDRIQSATLDAHGLTLVLTSPETTPTFDDPPDAPDSYIWLQSGDARFFGTVLVNARLLLVDDQAGRLHFDLYHYRAQTAAGRIRIRDDGTLIVRVPRTYDRNPAPIAVTQNAPRLH